MLFIYPASRTFTKNTRRLYCVSGIYPTSNTSTAKQTKTVPCVGYICNFKHFHSETNEDCTVCRVYIQLQTLPQRNKRRLYRVSCIYPTSNTSTAKQTKTVPCVGYICNFKHFHSETNEDCTVCRVYIQLQTLPQRNKRRLYRVSCIYPTSNTSTAKQTKTVPCVGYISNFKHFHSETNEDCTVCRVYIQLQTLPQRNKRSLYRVSGTYPTSNTSTTKQTKSVPCVRYISNFKHFHSETNEDCTVCRVYPASCTSTTKTPTTVLCVVHIYYSAGCGSRMKIRKKMPITREKQNKVHCVYSKTVSK